VIEPTRAPDAALCSRERLGAWCDELPVKRATRGHRGRAHGGAAWRRRSGSRHHHQRGSSVLYVVVLSPVLMLGIALATEAGGLQMQKQRLRTALDASVVVAAASASRAGTVAQLDPARAVAVMRETLVDNLQPLQSAFAAGTTAQSIARAAEVAVVTTVPAADPFAAGIVLRRPTLEVRVHIRVDTGLLAAAGLPRAASLILVASAGLRETAAT
jgi:hypothetical protein